MSLYSAPHILPIQNQTPQRQINSSNNFASHLLKISIAQIAKEAGFESVEGSVLDVLSEVSILYLEKIGKNAHTISETALRTQSTIEDVLLSLQKMNINLPDLVKHLDEMSGLRPVKSESDLRFPISEEDTEFSISKSPNPFHKVFKSKSNLPSSSTALPNFIPAFLPPFPQGHTFKESSLVSYKPLDNKTLGKMKHQQKQKIQNDLDHLNESLKLANNNNNNQINNNNQNNNDIFNNNNLENSNLNNINENRLNYPSIPTVIPFTSNLFSVSKKKKIKTFSQHDESTIFNELEPKQTHSEVEDLEQKKKKHRAESLLNLNHLSDNMINDF